MDLQKKKAASKKPPSARSAKPSRKTKASKTPPAPAGVAKKKAKTATKKTATKAVVKQVDKWAPDSVVYTPRSGRGKRGARK